MPLVVWRLNQHPAALAAGRAPDVSGWGGVVRIVRIEELGLVGALFAALGTDAGIPFVALAPAQGTAAIFPFVVAVAV